MQLVVVQLVVVQLVVQLVVVQLAGREWVLRLVQALVQALVRSLVRILRERHLSASEDPPGTCCGSPSKTLAMEEKVVAEKMVEEIRTSGHMLDEMEVSPDIAELISDGRSRPDCQDREPEPRVVVARVLQGRYLYVR